MKCARAPHCLHSWRPALPCRCPLRLLLQVIDCLLAAVGGIMSFLSLHELLPLAVEHAGPSPAVLSLFLGMALMSANLWVVARWLH